MRRFADADVVVVGPAPPLRGGIAAHTAGLVAALARSGYRPMAASYRRLYPSLLFPGRSPYGPLARPPWCEESLDVLAPASWRALARELEASSATVVLQWWHPVVAPALLTVARRAGRTRSVAVCHNLLPHERFPGSRLAARALLSSVGRVVCHGPAVAAEVAALLGAGAPLVEVPLPCLLDPRSARRPEVLRSLPPQTRVVAAAGHLRSYKAVPLLLEAWRRARRPPEARLVLLGESYLRGAERRAVARAILEDGSITLVDQYVEDEDLVGYLASAELLVAAHREASQSGILPIARALGLPCLVSDAGSLAGQAGAGAEVVPAGDAAALTAAIERRLEGPAHRFGDALREAGDFRDDWPALVEAIGIATRP